MKPKLHLHKHNEHPQMIAENKSLPKIKVLMYHRVVHQKPVVQDSNHYVTAEVFRRQIKFIDLFGFTPITFIDYKLYKEDKLTLPRKPIILTFDDGYLDTYELAVPLMQEKNMKGVVFAMGDRSIRHSNWDKQQNDDDSCALMSDKQLNHLREMGFEIGAHTMNHENLTTLDKQEITFQVNTSKRELEMVLSAPVYSFAYPYGAVNEQVVEAVKNAGFTYACGVYTGSPRFEETTLDFRRLAINQHTSTLNFLLKLLTPYQYLDWAYFRLKNRHGDSKQEVNRKVATEIN